MGRETKKSAGGRDDSQIPPEVELHDPTWRPELKALAKDVAANMRMDRAKTVRWTTKQAQERALREIERKATELFTDPVNVDDARRLLDMLEKRDRRVYGAPASAGKRSWWKWLIGRTSPG